MKHDEAQIYQTLKSMDIPDEQYLSAYIKLKLAEAMEALDQEKKLDAETKKKKYDSALNGFFATLSFVQHLSDPIEYEPLNVEQIEDFLYNIILIGNIGNGKSTLSNKFYQVLLYDEEVLSNEI